MTYRSSHDPQTGFKVLYEAEQPKIDIIAVHGIGAKRDATWTYGSERVCWLADPAMLPAVCPDSRILTYGYKSQWLGKDSVKSSITEISRSFLLNLHDVRRTNLSRAVVFIGHCFGGLVIEKALVDAQYNDSKPIQQMVQSLAGIILLGTPHHGSNSTKIAESVAWFAAMAGVGQQSKLLETLSCDSEILGETVQRFSSLARKGNWPLYCFYEEVETNIAKLLPWGLGKTLSRKTIVVDKFSACLTLGEGIGLALDHFQLNKFSGPKDEKYKSVRNAVDIMFEYATRCVTTLFNVPYPRNRNFFGRERVFESIGQVLNNGSGANRAGLYGLGGSGKTEIALEWAYRHQSSHSVLWVFGNSQEHLEKSFAEIGLLAKITDHSMPKDAIVSKVKNWLDSDDSGKWLMIIDNISDEPSQDTLTFLPVKRGAILFLSRNCEDVKRLTGVGHEIMVPEMTVSEGCQVLQRLSDLNPNDAKGQNDAKLLVRLLGYLPLAITQAASYLKMCNVTISEYSRSLKRLGRESRDEGAHRLLNQGPKPVMLTWQCSYQRILKESPPSAKLLKVLSLLFPDKIPISLLKNTASLRNFLGDSLDLALGILCSFSMISRTRVRTQTDDGCISMPRLVSLWVRQEAKRDVEWTSVAMMALEIVERGFPLTTIAARSAGSDLVTQVRAVLDCCNTAKGQSDVSGVSGQAHNCLVKLEYKLGRHLYHSGQIHEANEVFMECRKRCKTEKQWEESEVIAELEHYWALTLDALNHADNAMLMINKAYRKIPKFTGKQGILKLEVLVDRATMLSRRNPEEARKDLLGALQTYQKNFGEKKVLGLLILKSLAEVSQTLRDHKKALEYFAEAREIVESNFDSAIMLMVAIMLGEAETQHSLGDNDKAESTLDALKKVMSRPQSRGSREPIHKKLEEVLNAVRHMFQDHPWYDVYLQDFIGRTIMEQHQYAAAVTWFQSAFSKSAIEFGVRNMVSIYVRQNLANAQALAMRHDSALKNIDQVIQARIEMRIDNRDILMAKQAKADLLIRRGEINAATQLLTEIRDESHPKSEYDIILFSMMSLGQLCSIRGDQVGAIKKYKQALTGFEKCGFHRAFMLNARQRIASARTAQGKPEKARMILEDILESNSEPSMIHVERTLELASALVAMGEVDRANLEIIDAQRLFRLFGGKEDSSVKQFMFETEGECHQASGRFEESLRCYEHALQVAETQFRNPSHPDILQVWKKIGDVKMKLSTTVSGNTEVRKFEQEAKQAYWKCYDGYLETFGSENVHTKTALACLRGNDIRPLRKAPTEIFASELPIRRLKTMMTF